MPYATFDKMIDHPFNGKFYNNVMKDFLTGDWTEPNVTTMDNWLAELEEGYSAINFLAGYEMYAPGNDTVSFEDNIFVIKLALKELDRKIKE